MPIVSNPTECCRVPTALNVSCGSVDDFECGNGDCINYSLTCDGMAHCKDKSDEKQSYCGESRIRKNVFLFSFSSA